MKKCMALLLALLMVFSLAVTASAAPKEKAVKVVLPNYDSPSGTDQVEAAINAITTEKYGVKLDIEFISTGNYAQQTNLMLTSDEVDVFALFGTPFDSYVNNGQLYELTEYWNNTTDEFKAEWDDADLKPFIVDGQLYAIPNFRDYGGYLGAMIDEEIAAEFGLVDRQDITWEEFDAFLQKAHEKYPERYGLIPSGGTCLISSWTWDGLGDSSYIGALPVSGQESTTVVPLFECEDFLNFVTWARKWYVEGITMADILSNSESWKSLFAAKKAVAMINSVGVNNPTGLINVHLSPNYIMTSTYRSVSYGINANSSNPDLAWRVMEILYTDKEVGTLLTNGVEGVHYVRNEDGTASYPEGLDSTTAGYNLVEAYWFVPYCPNSLPSAANGGDFYAKLVAQKDNGIKSGVFGFAFNASEVIDEYTACTNVMSKYYKPLMSGAVDPESIMAQATSELEAAGLQTVIAEKQVQLDAFLGK